ncbi:MAG: PAS domain-containing sensor histidine kinase [Elusimicrobiota bacterium]|jgi:hypothetical protein
MALKTKFLPAERASEALVKESARDLSKEPLVKMLAEAVPDVFLILNPERQIVYSNRTLIESLGLAESAPLCGKRYGEAMACTHASESPGGCGTTEFCEACGAAQAVQRRKGREDVHECRITRENGEALDFRVWATPVRLPAGEFTVFVAEDIADEKRRGALERIFFHDVLNTVSGLSGLTEFLKDATPEESRAYQGMLAQVVDKLIEEITTQRDLARAESGELLVKPTALDSRATLEGIAAPYRAHPLCEGRTLALAADAASVAFSSDRTLLGRVLGNMTKNALEACPKGGTVTLSCRPDGLDVLFSVNGPTVMPREVQLQVFQRSFSTKGAGRGLGTYSMKLLGERYLHGNVSFESSEGKGTTFYAGFPLELKK